jgi:hypothetical protein
MHRSSRPGIRWPIVPLRQPRTRRLRGSPSHTVRRASCPVSYPALRLTVFACAAPAHTIPRELDDLLGAADDAPPLPSLGPEPAKPAAVAASTNAAEEGDEDFGDFVTANVVDAPALTAAAPAVAAAVTAVPASAHVAEPESDDFGDFVAANTWEPEAAIGHVPPVAVTAPVPTEPASSPADDGWEPDFEGELVASSAAVSSRLGTSRRHSCEHIGAGTGCCKRRRFGAQRARAQHQPCLRVAHPFA